MRILFIIKYSCNVSLTFSIFKILLQENISIHIELFSGHVCILIWDSLNIVINVIPCGSNLCFIEDKDDTSTNNLQRKLNKKIRHLKEKQLKHPDDIINEKIHELESNKKFMIFPSIRFLYFLTILKNAQFIIGNSSAAVREAEVFGTPAINIGSRQKNRSKNKEIVNVEPKKNLILNAIQQVENKRFDEKSFFGYVENTTERFLDVLRNPLVWKISIQKQFIDIQKSGSW